MKKLILILLFIITLPTKNNAQNFVDFDSLAFELAGYGYIEYIIPLEYSFDTTINDYTDSMIVMVNVDSLSVDSILAEQFFFINPVENVWIAHTLCIKEEQMIEDSIPLFYYPTCIIVHIVPPIVRYIWK